MSNLVIRRASFSDVPAFLALFVDYLAFYHVVQAPADCRRFLENRLKAGDAVVLLGSSGVRVMQRRWPSTVSSDDTDGAER